jgi:dTDP-4-dehydrorhamnose reductase
MIGIFGRGVLSSHFVSTPIVSDRGAVVFSRSPPNLLSSRTLMSWCPFSLGDIESSETLVALLKRNKITSAVIFSGISNPNTVQMDLGQACKVNLLNTVKLIDSLQKLDIFFVFISSVEVFNYVSSSVEIDEPCPKNYYGLIKAAVEKYIIDNGAPAAIVRTTWNIPSLPPEFLGQGRCPITLIYNSLISGASRWATDYVTNPVLALDTAKVIAKVISSSESGIFHSAGEVTYSRFELAQLVSQAMTTTQVVPESCLFQDLPLEITSRRSRVSVLSTAATRRRLGFEFSDIAPAIAEIICRLQKKYL